jgi:hypothetical protein
MIGLANKNLDAACFNAQAAVEQLDKCFSELTESVAQIVEPFRKLMLPGISAEVAAFLNRPMVPPEIFKRLRESIVAPDIRFQEMIAACAEEQRVAEQITGFGFVPHAILPDQFRKLGYHDAGADKKSPEELADVLWPKIRSKLELALDGCLGDQRLCQTYSEMLGAHEAKL